MTTSAKLLKEAEIHFTVVIVAIAKEINAETGERTGEFPCPRCGEGMVRWSIAVNGHACVACSRTWLDANGKKRRCTSAME